MAHGTIWWTELMTRDPKAACDFYAAVLGWSYDEMPMSEGDGTYYIGKAGETMAAGIMDMTGMPGMDGVPAHWFSYYAVADVDAGVQAVKDNGGTVLRDVFEVPGIGRIAIVQDNTGAAVGIMTPVTMAE